VSAAGENDGENDSDQMKILVLGASGMLGGAMLRVLSERQDWQVYGAMRSQEPARFFSPSIRQRLIFGVDVHDHDALPRVFRQTRPDVVINCISLSKQLISSGDPLLMISTYAMLPHRLADLCGLAGARLIHISSDGVFSGTKGGYTEDDPADATDLYGRCKFLGEVQQPHAVTLRTSLIGHELQGGQGLLAWFLSQQERCACFSKAIFSGLPTVTLAGIVRDIVIARSDLQGIYHVGAAPISKLELLRLVAEIYGKSIEIVPDDRVIVDRSLSAERFRAATGYVAPEWRELISAMHSYQSFDEYLQVRLCSLTKSC
jgi:dTDP-4-dehydrorhamnose reductase